MTDIMDTAVRAGTEEKTDADWMELCAKGTPEEVLKALENGVDVCAAVSGGETPLMRAAANNPDPEVAAMLLENGADIDAADDWGMTALMYAARSNPNAKVAELLLKNGADTETESTARPLAEPDDEDAEISVDSDDSELTETIKEILLEAVDFLADIFSPDTHAEKREKPDENSGMTALLFAARDNPNPEAISTLLNGGADTGATDDAGRTALMLSVTGNPNPEVAAALLENGANIDATDDDGKTALIWAAEVSNHAAVHLLLANGADAHIEDHNGKRAVAYARENERFKNTDVFRELLRASRVTIQR